MTTTGQIDSAFRDRYGPWGVITGASDGTGAAYARQLAARGLNLVLIARRPGPLASLAAELEEQHGIATRTASVDLYTQGAADQVLGAAEGLEVGLLISNAGADTNGKPFLDAPVDAWRQLIHRNVMTVMELAHGFAGPMRERGRGGIILMSSGAGLGGQPGVAVYSGTKAFDLNLAEGLWAELKDQGVDVLAGVCPAMDTPTFRRNHDIDIPGIFNPEEVVATLLDRLPDGPTHIFAFGPDAPKVPALEKARRQRVVTVSEITKKFFGKH